MLLSRNKRGKGSGVTIETVRECELANEIVVLALVRTTATLFLHERHMLVCERGCRGRQGLITLAGAEPPENPESGKRGLTRLPGRGASSHGALRLMKLA